MKIHEYQAKELLATAGASIPKHIIVSSFDGAEKAFDQLSAGGGVVLKAQVPTGGRMKAGGILFAESPAEASALTRDLLNRRINGLPVEGVLVETKLIIAAEVYIGVMYDATTRRATGTDR